MSIKKQIFTGILTSYNRLNCSVNRNPAYFGSFSNIHGDSISGRTASDAACAYGFLNNQYSVKVVTYHKTRNGNTIIDRLQLAQIEPGNIYAWASEFLPLDNIDHHESDLYLKVTPKSRALVEQLTNKSLLTTFKCPLDGCYWYELPFCYIPHFNK